MKTTLIYTDCAAKNAGDYAAAAEVAYTLQQYYAQINEDQRIILASSPEGVKKFQALYGNQNGLQLNIHGLLFEAVRLNEFAPKKEKVDQYIEVAFCAPPPADLLADFVNPLSTKIVYIGLAAYHLDFSGDQKMLTDRFPQSSANGLAHGLSLGFGKGRIGMPIYQGPCEPLNDKLYYDITKAPYGFAYFKGGFERHTETLQDYLKISTALDRPYQNFIFVGDCKLNLEAIKKFVMSTKKTTVVCDASEQMLYHFKFQNDTLIVDKEPLSANYSAANKTAIHIGLFSNVPSQTMRSLMHFSEPFICCEGIQTPTEAIAFGKILFLHFGDNNKDFYPTYCQALLDNVSATARLQAEKYLKLFLREKSLNQIEKKQLSDLLNSPEFCAELIKANQQLFAKLPNTALKIADALNARSHIDLNYAGPAFRGRLAAECPDYRQLNKASTNLKRSEASDLVNSFFGKNKFMLFPQPLIDVGFPFDGNRVMRKRRV